MRKNVAFIGHRDCLPNDIEIRLEESIIKEIELGSDFFTMGTHGEFDIKALNVCKKIKNYHKHIAIELVLTSLNQINPVIDYYENEKIIYTPYENVDTIMYEIEDIHFKKRIIESNKQIINKCNTLICYVNTNKKRSGSKLILNYAIKCGLKIINLYKTEDDPFYGMCESERKSKMKEFITQSKIKQQKMD